MDRIGLVLTAGSKKNVWMFGKKLPNIITWPIFKILYPLFGVRVELIPELKKETTSRLETALDLYNKGVVDQLFLAGGYSKFRQKTTTVLMKEWLVNKGVPEWSVFYESGSLDTSGNVENFLHWMKQGRSHNRRVFVITSDYHLKRAVSFLVEGGVQRNEIVEVAALPPKFDSFFQKLSDEYTYNTITECLKRIAGKNSHMLIFFKKIERCSRNNYTQK